MRASSLPFRSGDKGRVAVKVIDPRGNEVMRVLAVQAPPPVQPVEQPILCSPYGEPVEHWSYRNGMAERTAGRRRAGSWWKSQRANLNQVGMFEEEQFDELPLVNQLREDVQRWRKGGYEGATPATKELLRHWWRDDRQRPLFFCQLEAVETVIYLAEMRLPPGRRTRFAPAFADTDLDSLLDQPNDSAAAGLRRLGCKMATGSGKTVVMAMLVAWALCNRGSSRPMSASRRQSWCVART